MSYAKVRKELADQTDENRLPCMRCRKPTLREMLSHYGGNCLACYELYCRTSMTSRVDVGDKRKSPRDWVQALQRRHAAGEQLSKAQVDAYQAVLRMQPSEDA